MRLMLEFKRYGAARYLSHLDMQRNFMRAVRRAGLNPEYSQGYNPHMLLSFASAMPVGLESGSEYLEIRLLDNPSPEYCLKALKKTLPEGFEPVWAGTLGKDAPKLMAALKYAGYEALIKNGDSAEIKNLFNNLLKSAIIELEYIKNGGIQKRDIRPMINEIKPLDGKSGYCMLLSLSSSGSLYPDALMEYAAEKTGIKIEYEIRRTGLFTTAGDEIIPLRGLGKR